MHYVYVLCNDKKEYYIGYTNDLEQRLSQHAKQKSHFSIVYHEGYVSSKAARDRERKLKHYGSAWRAVKARIQAA